MPTTYTPEQRQAFKESFRKTLKLHYILGAVVAPPWLAMMVMGITKTSLDRVPDFIIGAVGLWAILGTFGVLLISFDTWRCPACQCWLGRGFAPSLCPECGVELR
jgi:hypothetical protein